MFKRSNDLTSGTVWSMAVKILSSVAHSGHTQCGLPLTSTNESPDVQITDQSEGSMSPIVGNQRPLGDEILDTLIPSLSPFIQSRGWMSVRLFSKGLGAASHCWLVFTLPHSNTKTGE